MRLFSTLILLLWLPASFLLAQNKQYTTAQDSDRAAVALVKDLRTKYDGYRTIEADFRLDIALPGRQVETQLGKLQRRGDEVRFRLGDQEGIITTDAAYVIQHGNKEVMINNLPEPGEATGMLTPQTLFSFYEGDSYVLALQGEDTVDGRLLQSVELKPVDRNNSEFTKLRLLVDRKKKELVSVRAFAPDGSNYTFHLDQTRGNAALADGTFRFRKDDFPGYHVEDLRY